MTGMVGKIKRNTRHTLARSDYRRENYIERLKNEYYHRHIATVYSNGR